ncbi:hypothetical protein GGF37_001250 [Kickxella alabastrina]|nr:hypothetical protein GGF37_001250 [Kickxella alabastrina]
MSELPGFTLPTVFDNPKGWGPSNSQPTGIFRDIPYIPFSKGDKVARVANWINPTEARDTRDTRGGRRQRDQNQQAYGSNSAAAFAYAADEDEESFSLVDNRGTAMRKIAVRAVQGGGPRGGARGGGAMQRLGRGGRFAGSGRGFAGGFRRRFGYRDGAAMQRSASVAAEDDWQEVQEIQFNRMKDLRFDAGEPVEAGKFGTTGVWDPALDRLSVRLEKPLTAAPAARFNVSASDDPVLAKIAEENEQVKVLATDTVVAALMAATVANTAWDVVVNRVGDRVYLDKRDGGPMDFASVNEGASPPPPSEPKDAASINGASLLAQEARDVTRSLISQVTASKKVEFGEANPFSSAEGADANAYRYRTFNLGTQDAAPCLMAVRTEVDGLTAGAVPKQLFVRALTQHDVSAVGAGNALDWRLRLDAQRGAIIATEMMNNSSKLARWAFQAMLAGADQMKIGFVARVSPRDRTKHGVLGVQTYRPEDFLGQLGLNEYNAWGIVKALVDLCLQLEEGKYVIMRDPNNPLIRIYAVPEGTFEEGIEEAKDEDENE